MFLRMALAVLQADLPPPSLSLVDAVAERVAHIRTDGAKRDRLTSWLADQRQGRALQAFFDPHHKHLVKVTNDNHRACGSQVGGQGCILVDTGQFGDVQPLVNLALLTCCFAARVFGVWGVHVDVPAAEQPRRRTRRHGRVGPRRPPPAKCRPQDVAVDADVPPDGRVCV